MLLELADGLRNCANHFAHHSSVTIVPVVGNCDRSKHRQGTGHKLTLKETTRTVGKSIAVVSRLSE